MGLHTHKNKELTPEAIVPGASLNSTGYNIGTRSGVGDQLAKIKLGQYGSGEDLQAVNGVTVVSLVEK